MRIVVRDHDRNRRAVYNFRTVRSQRNNNSKVKDSDDDKIKELEERIDELEKEIEKLSTNKEEPSAEKIDVDEEDLDEVDEDETDEDETDEDETDEDDENEKVEDLGDSFKFGDSKPLPRKSLRSIGALSKTSTKDSTTSDVDEINAWANRENKGDK